jgi:ubiquinone/menaquinone biosynthesis C-methylase UbiE
MPTNAFTRRLSQVAAWAVASLFVLGFFFDFIGMVTGPILGVWFVGTQKLRRGFLWMLAIGFLPGLITDWRKFPLTGSDHGLAPALGYVAWMLVGAVLGVLPFTFHRLVSPRLPGFLCTLPFPLAKMALPSLALALHYGPAFRVGVLAFFLYWFAAVVVWMWNHEFRPSKIGVGASIFAGVFILAAGFVLFRRFSGVALSQTHLSHTASSFLCLAGVLILSVWAIFRPGKHTSWAERLDTVTLLQSPFTGNSLHVVSDRGREALVSPSGERFPVRNGIPTFLKPEDLTGANRKYNHLYETIGGFYDDIQRAFCAFRGFDVDAYFVSYMRLLEVKPGDSVLETSVGTGLNFKYLPRGVKLSGLDLSPEMLANCQANLLRWEMNADLYLGNAESLPFVDSSFDVVFHVGGINFFNDRAKAIREMIRVAKPGSLLLIADETEEHVKSAYETTLGTYFKGRKEPVTAPIDLVPPEMQDIHLELIKSGHFYALTFRKPASA